jgi:hypothetical protein
MPALLQAPGQAAWPHLQRLLLALLRFMEPYLRNADLIEAVRVLYKVRAPRARSPSARRREPPNKAPPPSAPRSANALQLPPSCRLQRPLHAAAPAQTLEPDPDGSLAGEPWWRRRRRCSEARQRGPRHFDSGHTKKTSLLESSSSGRGAGSRTGGHRPPAGPGRRAAAWRRAAGRAPDPARGRARRARCACCWCCCTTSRSSCASTTSSCATWCRRRASRCATSSCPRSRAT